MIQNNMHNESQDDTGICSDPTLSSTYDSPTSLADNSMNYEESDEKSANKKSRRKSNVH